jgi:hypothetical protein
VVEQRLATAADVIGSSDPRFRVEPGQLARSLHGLEILLDTESVVADTDGRNAALARVVARKPPSPVP